MGESEYPKVYLYRRIVQAKLYMDRNFAEAIDLDNIADEAFFSKFHFIRLFKNAYQRTPHQYLTHVRVNEAMLLLKTETTIAEVCHSVGFDSISSFTGLFKRVNGITPSAYQTRELEKSASMAEAPLKFVPSCFAEKNGWSEKSNFEEGAKPVVVPPLNK